MTDGSHLSEPPVTPEARSRPLPPPLVFGLLALAWGGLLLLYPLALRPDPITRVDKLLLTGQYYAAVQETTAQASTHAATDPLPADVLLRSGMLAAIRGDYPTAERLLWQAISGELDPPAHELALLYLGHTMVRQQPADHAATRQVWRQRSRCRAAACPLAGAYQAIQAEWRLQQGDYAAAEDGFRAALELPLGADWQRFASYRLALVQAARTPETALALLAAPTPRQNSRWQRMSSPLIPARALQNRARLHELLTTPPHERRQLLGQMYTALGMDELALQVLQATPAVSPHQQAARAHIAYLQWRSSQHHASTSALETLALLYPDEPGVQTLLVLAEIIEASQQTTSSITATTITTDTLVLLPDERAATSLAWGVWHLSQRDYLGASTAFQQALEQASAAQRGRFALTIARFHLDTAYEICTDGRAAAESAVRALPESSAAWGLLAAARYQCGEFAPAIAAAETALLLAERTGSPAAAAHFYLGAALAHQGNPAAARPHLIRAADLAPASVWRERAELLLDRLAPVGAAPWLNLVSQPQKACYELRRTRSDTQSRF